MMNQLLNDTFLIRTSFKKLLPLAEEMLASESPLLRLQGSYIQSVFEKYPALAEGFSTLADFEKYQQQASELMEVLFPKMLTNNEIKVAVHPVDRSVIYQSERFKQIDNDSENNLLEEVFRPPLKGNFPDLLSVAIILNGYYGFDTDVNVPRTLTLQMKDGKIRKYRITGNGDFLDLYPNADAVPITDLIVDEIMSNISSPEMWQRYFPPKSWQLEGFMMFTLTDITLDEEIDSFKENLITIQSDAEFVNIQENIKNIFGLDELIFGKTYVNKNQLTRQVMGEAKSLMLNGYESIEIAQCGMENLWEEMYSEGKPVVISNLDLFKDCVENNVVLKNLHKQNIKSIAFIPIFLEEGLYNIFEIGSTQKNKINPINILKLETLLPFITSFAKRSIDELHNRISAVIQEECTSIHPAVKWRFEEEAIRFLSDKRKHKHPIFREIVFEDVYPLYAQVDIVGSSQTRNKAIQSDLIELLSLSKQILVDVTISHNMLFYEQLIFETDVYISELTNDFQANTEQKVSNYFENEIYPVLDFLQKSNYQQAEITSFFNRLNNNKTLYVERQKYDNTVDVTNKILSDFLDEKQKEAQAIFPHYFQKYKTDGIEHDMYVGQSIAQNAVYHESILNNLRLWQLQTVCQMEMQHYATQSDCQAQLKVASLILAYDMQMSIRYRIDEKKFDVDGTYNVRYEIIKKRIDKALVKNTQERLTQPGKIAIVYANRNTEREYINYVNFLRNKGYFTGEIEILELEDLQGAVGLKAIRVEINQTLNKMEKAVGLQEIFG